MHDAPARILVINVSRIGDTLFATPALRALATAWPQAEITVLAHPNRAEVLRNLPFLHKVGAIEKRRARFMGLLGRKSYDLALVYGHDVPLLDYALRVAKRVVAFRQDDDRLNRRLRVVVDAPAPYSEHAVLTALRLTAALGVPAGSRRIAYAVTEWERAEAAGILRAAGLERTAPLIGLQSASFPTKAYRNWPIEHFSALAHAIAARWPQAGFAVFGGPADRERTAALKAAIGANAVDLAGRPLRVNGAVMSLLDAYVGVDTGPTHIMSSFDIPLIGLYHCLLPHVLFGPLDHPMDFSIDHPRLGGDCSEATLMAEIGVATVAERLQEALAGRA